MTGDAGAFSPRALCEASCRNATVLACAQAATCTSDCESDYATLISQAPGCGPQLQGLLICAATLPLADWMCNSEGKLQAREGACKVEADRAVSCVFGGA
jgi:hypothetical protein